MRYFCRRYFGVNGYEVEAGPLEEGPCEEKMVLVGSGRFRSRLVTKEAEEGDISGGAPSELCRGGAPSHCSNCLLTRVLRVTLVGVIFNCTTGPVGLSRFQCSKKNSLCYKKNSL